MKRLGWIGITLAAGLVGFACGEPEEKESPPSPVPAAEAPASSSAAEESAGTAEDVSKETKPDDNTVFRFRQVVVDRKQGVVAFDAVLVQAQYGLEYLLCKAGTKEHESLMSTQAPPWQIHAGLLMLGLAPGKAGGFFGDEDHRWYVPPRGAGIKIEFEWTDRKGQSHRVEAHEWLKLSDKGDMRDKPARWVFLGSEVLPNGQYWADLEGGIISVENVSSAVIDVPFPSPQQNETMRAFEINTDAIPPAGTVVKVVLTPEKDAAKAPHARALLEIDRLGRMRIDDNPVSLDALGDWAYEYTTRHAKGMVVIRSEALAPAMYSTLARTELKIGGVFEFEEETAPLFTPLLPLTSPQARASLDDWAKRFAEPWEQIRDPGKEVLDTLEELERQREEARVIQAVRDDYEKQLRAQLEQYRRNPPAPPEAKGSMHDEAPE